jgi:peptidyl-prolyl cis-trans isomerase B (cyclophilin B)
MIKKLFLVILLFVSMLALSGCSQEPAAETVQNRKSGDYSYLSRAMSREETGAPSGTPQNALPKSAQASLPTSPPTVAGESTEKQETPPRETPSKPVEEKKPEEKKPENKKPESGPDKDDDLSYIRKYDGAIIKTTKGDITVKFYNDDAPKTVNNFFKLAGKDFYDGIRFHRVIEGFIIQAGDPNSKDDNWSDDGQGGPGYTFDDEINSKKLIEGSVAMANSGPNTNGSQFFIVTAKSAPLLDGKYTNFGEVTDGMDVVRKIEKVDTDQNDHPKETIEIKSIKFVEKK